MSNFSLVLKNCNLINEDSIVSVDIGIKDDRIEKIDSQITSESNEVIDLEGNYVAPGIIDDQVHFRDPGLTEKGDIHSESLAAVFSGVTSTFDMPNVDPNTTTIDLRKFAYGIEGNKAFIYFGRNGCSNSVRKKQFPKSRNI